MEPQIWFFRGLGLQERLPSEVLEHLTQEGRVERWGHQAEIFHNSAQGRVYIVLNGGVFIHDGSREQRVRLKKGDVFGGLIADDVVPNDVNPTFRRHLQAFDDTLLVSLNRLQFESLAQPHLSNIEAKFSRLGKSKEYNIPISPLLYSSPVDRFAKIFIHLAQEHGNVDGESARIDFPFHPHQVAPFLGVDNTYSKQIADQFMRRGLIENSPDFVTIPNMNALRGLIQSNV